MGKVLPNRLYLFLTLKWVCPCFKSNNQYNEPLVRNKHKYYNFLLFLDSKGNISIQSPPLFPKLKICCYGNSLH